MLTCDFLFTNKLRRLNDLSEAVQFCSLCERMENKAKILSYVNGNPDAKVLFIAEAPGRLGADRTGLPLFGDKTGSNFESLLKTIGWSRDDIFITNALLCNPIGEKGTNITPSVSEIKNCSVYVAMTLALINPEVIVTLGRIALESLNFICSHSYTLANNVAKPCTWGNYKLFPLYHPGPRAMVHRSFSKQTADYIALSHLIHPVKGFRKKRSAGLSKSTIDNSLQLSTLQIIVNMIVQSLNEASYFKLNKLLYLIDYQAIIRWGESATGQLYLRQQEGPWLPRFRDELAAMDGYEINLKFMRGTPVVQSGTKVRLHKKLSDNIRLLVNEILSKYGHLSDFDLKKTVYLSSPMKYILKAEKTGLKKINTPVLTKNKTAIELDE